MFSVYFYWCISYSVISYLLTAVFGARLMRLIKSVIHSFIYSFNAVHCIGQTKTHF